MFGRTTQKKHIRSTSHQHRSFILKKQDSFSTNQSTNIHSRSFVSKTYPIHNIQALNSIEQNNNQTMPLQAMFDNNVKTTFVKKVIDSFFFEPNPQQKVFTRSTADKHKRDFSKLLLLKQRRNNLNKIQLVQKSGENYFKKPPTPFFDQTQQNKSLPIIEENNIVDIIEERTSPIFDNQSWSNFDTNSIGSSRRPFSQYKQKKNFFNSDDKIGGTISINFQDNSPRQMQKTIWKKIDSNLHFQTFSIYNDKKLIQKAKIYHDLDDELLKRQIKIKKKGIKTLWNLQSNQRVLRCPITNSLKQKLKYQIKYCSSYQTTIKIFPKPYFNQLFLNNNEELKDIIRGICELIIKNQGKILTASIKLQNVHKLDQKDYRLSQLEYSAISEDFKIRGITIDNFTPPLIYYQNQWKVSPEYLSPELINSVRQNNFEWIKNNSQLVKASQIWSLGCMLIELITLLPLNENYRSWINESDKIMRKGFLSTGFNGKHLDFQRLLKKQKALKSCLKKTIQIQSKQLKINKNILQILFRMIQFQPSKRITPQEALSILNKI